MKKEPNMGAIHEADLSFLSANFGICRKPVNKRITAFVVKPVTIRNGTGLMHFAHGWGCNRLMYADMMREFATRYNVVCVATEFRQSGYDFDILTGRGACRPYDASFMQVFDCLNAIRTVLDWLPAIDRGRMISFGVSQGGHIAALMTLFCPDTFALLVDGCGLSHFDAERIESAGRDFSPDELAIRDVVSMAGCIRCPVALMHGTADPLPVSHTRSFEAALRRAHATVQANYIEGGGHGFEPVTNYRDATVALADEWLRTLRIAGPDDFAKQSVVQISCVSKSLVIDWSKAVNDDRLVRWEPAIAQGHNPA